MEATTDTVTLHVSDLSVFTTGSKARMKVVFPAYLDQTQAEYFESSYRLIGAIEHTGSSTTYGHYVSFAFRNCKWFRFDDDRVTNSSEKEVLKCEVYCLFYMQIENLH
eukprot:GHVN01001935.1.p1 GENE.GHVN01001935.1~~GHVN01001935.1.p1  ORF type:complete len:108 (-),score=8.82 GHVN01001935.1:28-351(-)